MATDRPDILAVDVGKSHLRIALLRDGIEVGDRISGPSPGLLVREETAKQIAIAVTTAVSSDVAGLHHATSSDVAGLRARDGFVVAAAVAGAQEWPQQARELADRLAAIEGCGMALVASDLIAAHADACAAQPGTVLIAGTGAVAMGMHANGTTHVVDGLGPELGDRGSGYWIGRRGVREALRGKDLDLPATRPLLSRMLARFGGAPVLWPARTPPMTGNSYAILAAFAVDVIELAGEGDECASRIVSTAAGHLADTAIRAANLADSDHVVGYGGLLSRGNTSMRDAVEAGLHGNGLRFSATAGDGISAAASLIKSHPGYQGSVHIATAQDPTHQ